MSTPRKARFETMKASTHCSGVTARRRASSAGLGVAEPAFGVEPAGGRRASAVLIGSLRERPGASASGSFRVRASRAELRRLLVDLDAEPRQLVVAVPLHEVGAAHEGAVLGGAAEVVPEVELGELDRLVEGLRREQALGAEGAHHRLGALDL